MSKVKIGVIGLGDFGEKHVDILAHLPDVELVAVCSRTESRAREIASRYGAKKWYIRYSDLAEDRDIEAVSIATADQDHCEPTVAAAKAGKDILVEKPIATSLEDADSMITSAKKAGVILMVGHILRFDVRYVTIKEMLMKGLIGDVVSMYARRIGTKKIAGIYLKRVTPTVQAGIHDIDIMLWYTNSKVSKVSAEAYNISGYLNPDIMWCTLRFANGAIGVVENAYILPENYPSFIDAKLEVLGTKASAHIDVPDMGLRVCSDAGFTCPDTVYWPFTEGGFKGALREELRYFVQCVREGKEPSLIRPEEAKLALQVAVSCVRSVKEDRAITLS